MDNDWFAQTKQIYADALKQLGSNDTVRTIGTLFSGFGGVDIGAAMSAGVAPVWAVEYDAAIAAVCRQNIGDHVRVGDILDTNPADFEMPDILHASPPCPNFSQAKKDAAETEADIALAQKVADFIAELLPPFFTLENVFMYRLSQSWRIIAQTLMTHGYQFNYWRVNMADYGVPQTRQRMVVIARRDGIRPQLPPQTHAQNPQPQPTLFGGLQRWVSWYEAIEDLIPGLPDSEFAPWQVERLAGTGSKRAVRAFVCNDSDSKNPFRNDDTPAATVVASGAEYNRAAIAGRVVKMTPRCLARLQSFPDWYALPEATTVATRGIGNAVPPLFYQRLTEGLS